MTGLEVSPAQAINVAVGAIAGSLVAYAIGLHFYRKAAGETKRVLRAVPLFLEQYAAMTLGPGVVVFHRDEKGEIDLERGANVVVTPGSLHHDHRVGEVK
jgi:hypothetical protein